MSKFRKSSLSPCYAVTNKENLPLDNGISFKNLEKAKKLQTYYHANPIQSQSSLVSISRTPQHNESYCPSQSRNKAERDHQDYRSTLKSKQKQMSSLHSQVRVLQNTVQLLKEQLQNVSKQNKRLVSSFDVFQKNLKEKDQVVARLKEENSQINAQLQEYKEILPNLNQLEEIQNGLIEQNAKLKGRDQITRSVLKNIKNLIGNQRSELGTKICELIKLITVPY